MISQTPAGKKFDLRWRFDFAARPEKYGKWSAPGNTPEVKAHLQMKEGLTRASIEGRDVETGAIGVIAECDGHDFVNFQWMACAMAPGAAVGVVRPLHMLVGLKIVTREWHLCAYADGRLIKRPRPDAEKQMNLAIFGR